ncbi:MAG: biotin carboxylase N-terminal domain-containing protein [Pseudomonadota bacterium]
MFETILIANRGEIACRIIDTARAMGVRCVAVYSDADAQARHVAMADVAVHIGGSAPADSYLRGDAIIDAALKTGAQAIHPGYGFLSENPDFVEAVAAAGLTFIGPSADAIRAMGLKDAAKALMQEAGVPVVPGYQGADQGADLLAQEAARIGYPVMIKAIAGGGGKGMRVVDAPDDFAAALASAKTEAQTAFGNDTVLIEKYIAHPRHIEVQVFGDGVRTVHLNERDCSLQRRHQKVIEEAPAPGMSAQMRAAMGAAAVRAAEAVGYKGAGTVEFIVDGTGDLRPDRFYFMEMNTRLQVEHPVTEAITGIDLVAWQLRVAAGDALPLGQDAIPLNGHAFEARLYAEDVPAGFLPAIGRLSHLAFPDSARADTGVRASDEISPFYDPMIAKLIVHGPTRAIALGRLRRALAATQVAGTTTNLAFLGALAHHPGFSAGQVDTGLIARDFDTMVPAARPSDPAHVIAAAMTAARLEERREDAGFALWAPLRRTIALANGDGRLDPSVEVCTPDHQRWHLGEDSHDIFYQNGVWSLDGIALPQTARDGDDITVFDQGGIGFTVPDPLDVGGAAGAGADVILAPMPGLVSAILAQPGDDVAQGQSLAVLEAMKMEHQLTAAVAGRVAEVLVQQGDQVTAGAPLIRMETAE